MPFLFQKSTSEEGQNSVMQTHSITCTRVSNFQFPFGHTLITLIWTHTLTPFWTLASLYFQNATRGSNKGRSLIKWQYLLDSWSKQLFVPTLDYHKQVKSILFEGLGLSCSVGYINSQAIPSQKLLRRWSGISIHPHIFIYEEQCVSMYVYEK